MADEKQADAQQPAVKQPEGTEQAKAKKNKKINKMSLQEIEQGIEKTGKIQGGLNSRYASELLKRKNYLTSLKK
jgi:hypothetical protein